MNPKNDTNVLLTEPESITSTKQGTPIPTDGEWGIDTINLSFPISLEASDYGSTIWKKNRNIYDFETGEEYSGLTGVHHTPHGDVFVNLNLNKERCYIQFNAARILHGKSRKLLPPAALKNLVGGLLTDLQYSVTASFDIDINTGTLERQVQWAKQVRISRLDLARNLYIPYSLNEVKKALELAKSSYGKTKVTYSKSDGGWTVVNGTASTGQDRIYDKSAELANFDIEEKITQDSSWLRFEAQLQKDRLKRAGLTNLEAVTTETSWEALEQRWKACKWAVTITEPGTVQTALAGLSAKRYKDVAGFLVMASFGHDVLLGKKYQAEMRKICRDLGLIPGVNVYEQGVGLVTLDLYQGGFIEYTQG